MVQCVARSSGMALGAVSQLSHAYFVFAERAAQLHPDWRRARRILIVGSAQHIVRSVGEQRCDQEHAMRRSSRACKMHACWTSSGESWPVACGATLNVPAASLDIR